MPDLQIYVLDRHRSLVPPGVVGEMYVGGDGLALAYLNRPELTAERFVPNPFASRPGDRLYRSGDLARWAGGELEYLGRIDHQVKIRGFRIELGEIEAVLGRHPAVRGTIVLAREKAGEVRLVAYLVPAPGAAGASPDLLALREHLLERLPEYMIPSSFVVLESLPLTPNGKVDRRALPEPAEDRSIAGQRFIAPRDALELALAGIWEELLGIHPIGVLDDFFALGGHSMLAIRLVSRIRTRVGRNLSPAELFQAPSIERLAALLRRQAPSERSVLVEIQPGGSRRPLFCVHQAGGDVLCFSALARELGSDQPFYAFQAIDPDLARVEDMAARYLDALRRVQPQGPHQLAGWSLGGQIAFEMARRLREEGEAVDLLAVFDVSAPLAPIDEEVDVQEQEVRLARYLWSTAGQECPFTPDGLRDAGVEALQRIYERAMQDRVIPPDVDFADMIGLFRMFTAHLQARRRYVGKPYDGRMVLIRAAEEVVPGVEETLGWRELAAGGVEVRVSSGQHANMVYPPHVEELARQLRQILDAMDRGGS
jgi:thioesterase domain-containing protein